MGGGGPSSQRWCGRDRPGDGPEGRPRLGRASPCIAPMLKHFEIDEYFPRDAAPKSLAGKTMKAKWVGINRGRDNLPRGWS